LPFLDTNRPDFGDTQADPNGFKKIPTARKKIEVLARPHWHIWFCLPAHKPHPKAKPKEPNKRSDSRIPLKKIKTCE
jgi:hypothetical protein